MDFFEHQDVARRRTGRLIALFVVAVVAIVLAIYAAVVIAMVFLADSQGVADVDNAYMQSPFHPGIFAAVAVATIAVIFLGSAYKTAQLASGGESVALMMGGRPIDPNSGDPAERRLINVVQEMAVASGTPVPPVYVMDKEPSINAFAAGFGPDDAVIGVSRGSLDYLTRDELQGVMAHEFSHILNGDMRLNLRLVGVLHGILVIALIGWFVIRSVGFSSRTRSSGNKKDGGGVLAILAVGLGLLIIGGVGLLFGKLIKMAVSRQREYLADAAAVQFTRLPDGIAGALKKIGARPDKSKIQDAHAEEISHMFFGNAFGAMRAHALSTHPPLADRIHRIDPSFDGRFPKRLEPVSVTRTRRKTRPKPKPGKPMDAILPGGAVGALDPAGIFGKIGVPDPAGLIFAAALLEDLLGPAREAAHEPYGARAVIYAVLLDGDAEMRRKQLDVLKPRAEELSFRETQRLAQTVDQIPEETKLPLVEMTVPALKRLSPSQYAAFRDNVVELVRADGKIELFEYAVHMLLLRQLDVHFGHGKPIAVRHHRLEPMLPSLVKVLSALAHEGHADAAAAEHAFAAGMSQTGHTATLLPADACTQQSLGGVLKDLAETAPKLKKQILTACVTCIAADHQITPHEAQLTQAVAAVLGVPIPPLMTGRTAVAKPIT